MGLYLKNGSQLHKNPVIPVSISALGAGAWHQMVGTYVHHDENNKWIIRKWKSDTGDPSVAS